MAVINQQMKENQRAKNSQNKRRKSKKLKTPTIMNFSKGKIPKIAKRGNKAVS